MNLETRAFIQPIGIQYPSIRKEKNYKNLL